MTETLTVAIIVPVYNEAAIAANLADRLTGLVEGPGVEIAVVDGGSGDGTADRLRAAGVPVLVAGRGRAAQMNAGAAATSAPVLLFLHADTTLPPNGLELIQAALDRGSIWGRFDIDIAGVSRWFPLIAGMINLRTRLTGHATGDQAMFVRRHVFDDVGRFPEQPLMEDVELSRRLRRIARPACIAARARTSGRRWEAHGVWRTVLLMWRLRFAYWRGVPAEKLASLYG